MLPGGFTAELLNARLANGGRVQVTTYAKSWIYSRRHAGMFFERAGDLYVKRGKSCDCLTYAQGTRLLVSIRLA